MKGASLVFEQVMLFVLGLTIFMMCYFLFSSYELYFTDSITQNQLEDVGELLASSMISLSHDSTVNSTKRLSVPLKIGNEHYTIDLIQEGMSITTLYTGRSLFLPLSTLNSTFSLSGSFSTVHGSEFLIYKKGDQIIIG